MRYVCQPQRGNCTNIHSLVLFFQTLSIEPINGHVLELLNLALETSATNMSFLKKAMPRGEQEWEKNMRERTARDKGKATATPGSTSLGTSTSGADEEMSL